MRKKRINLVNGFLVVPEEVIVVEVQNGNADYAGILAERTGRLPHYAILLDRPITELEAEEEEDLFAYIGRIYPEIAEVHAKEVSAVIENKTVLNAAEWQRSPRLGLFAVPEVADEDHLYLGTGIIRT